jgi:aryl-alcohol dehydrogenase-like predicted oxidoreductase
VDYKNLGRTGLKVSAVGLGCGNFGGIGSAPAFFGKGETEEEAGALMDAAWDMGINFFDTADTYGGGRSETYIGHWLQANGPSATAPTTGACHGATSCARWKPASPAWAPITSISI